MCGIAGVIGEADAQHAERAVRDMTAALARRGPDDEGLESFDGAVLGHRRLSIYDLSAAGHQPMVSADGSTAVVFNGSIYNFPDLRRDLQGCGHGFRSSTDTEVLLQGYRQWGVDGLVERLRGMFAFALWDARERRAYLIRDRLGVKPLVYAVRGGRLAFASTPRALRAAGLAGEIDPQAIAEYCEFGYVTQDRTVYRGVKKVPQATIIEFSNGRLTSREYWSPPAINTVSPPTFEEAVEETERLLLQAVKRRLFADVPVGALLSGGVDSSLTCWAIAELGGDVTAFTVGTPGDAWDETADAQRTAATLGITHRVLASGPEASPGVDELVSAFGEPFACASALGMLMLSGVMKGSVTVMVTGDGGDDVFLGYPEHLYLWASEKLGRAIPSPAARSWYSLRRVVPRVGVMRRGMHFLDYATGGIGALSAGREGLPEFHADHLFGERLREAAVPDRNVAWSPLAGRRVLTDFIDYDRRTRFVSEYLTKVDGASMHYALEARSPFLDQDLWEFAAALPFSVRLRGRQQKAVLRELARRRVGSQVARGKKRGFGIPVQRWIAGRWAGEVEQQFRGSQLAKEGWVDRAAVCQLLDRSKQTGWAPNRLWYLYVLEAWFKRELSVAAEPLGVA